MALNTAHFQPLHKLNLLTLALIAVLIGIWPQTAFAQGADQQVIDSINAARAENGLGPLAVNPLLNQAAQNHVNDMLTNYVYGHYGSDGSTVQMRVARTGYSDTPWVSENWVSASDAGGAMRWWMGDYIHRVNILTARWVEVGVGVGSRGSEMIFVTVFSAGGGSSSQTAAVAAGTPPQASPPPPSVHIEQVSVPSEGMDYTVSGGDTLLAIGLRYGLPWERIAEANGLNERSLLQIGQTVRIPGNGAPAAPPPPDVETEEYTVAPNDTLFTIAARRGMYWDDVAAVNGFGEHTVLQIGQVIQVPVVEEPEVALVTTPVVTPREVGPVPAERVAKDFNNYTLKQLDPSQPVQADASPAGISQPMLTSTGIGGPTGEIQQVAMAQSPGVGATSVVLAQHAVVQEANLEQDSAPVTSSEVTSIEAASTEVASAKIASEPTLYVVEPGDTIISIAVKHDLEWGPLLALNGLGEDTVLQLGQTLRLR